MSNVSYNVVYVHKPASWERVADLLNEIEADEREIDYIESVYGRGNRYNEVVERIRNTFTLAENLVAELDARENGHEL